MELESGDFPVGMSQPSLRALEQSGVTSLAQLANRTEKEIKNLHGMGPKGIRLLKAALEAKGLSFKSEGK